LSGRVSVSFNFFPETTHMFRSDIHFAAKEDVGQRSAQEDYSSFQVGTGEGELLAVLADGMGGHSGGQVASHKAVNAFQAMFRSYPSGSVATKLGVSLNQANTELLNAVRDKPELDGMGCTLVGAYFSEEGLHWISVGDSPLFLYRGGALTRLNADHSMTPVIEESVRRGSITRQDALSHPDRHALRSAVTGTDITLIDTSTAPVPLLQDDVVILASDGLLTLSDKEICSVIQGKFGASARDLSHALISAVVAKNKTRQDNTTVQVVVAPRALGTLTGSAVLTLWLVAATLVLVIAGGLIYSWREGALWQSAPSEPNEKTEIRVVNPTPVPVDPPASVPATPTPDETTTPEKKSSEASKAKPEDETPGPAKSVAKPKLIEKNNKGVQRVDPSHENGKSHSIVKPPAAAAAAEASAAGALAPVVIPVPAPVVVPVPAPAPAPASVDAGNNTSDTGKCDLTYPATRCPQPEKPLTKLPDAGKVPDKKLD